MEKIYEDILDDASKLTADKTEVAEHFDYILYIGHQIGYYRNEEGQEKEF